MKKKKKKKKVLLISLLAVFVIAAAGITFARYQSKGTGSDEIKVAKWAVKVNTVDITPANATEFNPDITWTNADNVVEGFIAPGMTGTAPITINPEGSQVAMNYWIQVTSDLTGNENVTIQGVTVDGAALNIVPETAGTCSDKSITTQAECNGDKSWTADPHIGMYAGTINLPATGAMTATDAVKAIVTVEWKDLNTEAANIIDTETGTKASSETTNNLTVNVIVEQKVN